MAWMSTVQSRWRERSRALSAGRGPQPLVVDAALQQRVAVLEEEVQECRQLNLRLAELTDVVEELLLPVAQRDDKRLAAVLEKYSQGL